MEMERKNKHNCCVSTCKGERFDLVHKFPRCPKRAQKWLNAIDSSELYSADFDKLSKIYQVCSRHFRIQDYKHSMSRSLNMNVVPSINLVTLNELHLSREGGSEKPSNLISDDNDKEDQIEQLSTRPVVTEPFECIEMITDDFELKIDDKYKAVSDLTPTANENIDSDSFPTFLEVTHPAYAKKLFLDVFWLRCHCRCTLCYDPTTLRRKINPIDIPNWINAKSVRQVDDMDVLLIEWQDGHESEFDVSFLMESQISRESEKFSRKSWDMNSDGIKQFNSIEFKDFITCDDEIDVFFQNLCHYGVAIIENIPSQSTVMAKLVQCRLFPHLEPVNFEEQDGAHSDICTNITYSSADSGLKGFFIKEKILITLVDGLNCALKLETSNPDAFHMLSDTKVPWEINEKDVKWRNTAPVIEVRKNTGEILHLRLDVHVMGVLNTLSQKQMSGFYDALRQMISLTQDETNKWTRELQPGTMLILDNWRIFFKNWSNSGVLQFHVGRKDFVSRLRFLGFV